MTLLFTAFLLIYAFVIYYVSRVNIVLKVQKYKILPVTQLKYYGYFAVSLSYSIWFFVFLASLLSFKFGFLLVNAAQLFIANSFLLVVISFVVLYKTRPQLKAQRYFERNIRFIMMCVSSIAFIVTILIIASIIFETYKFFHIISPVDFFTSSNWMPQDNLQNPNLGKSFGIMPLLAGTLLITAISLIVATPLGIFSAIFLSEYISTSLRFVFKPVIEMLSGIPTVVYGYFAALYMGPYIRNLGEQLHLDTSSESALAAGIVLGIMIIPYIISLSDDVFRAIPTSIRDASLGLGATKFETITKVVIPAASPGLIGSIMLAFSRAIGETMIVVMASGLTARMTMNPLQSVTTVTAQIVSILTGDQEFGSVKTLAAFALAFTLFCLTLLLNILAQNVMNKHKSQFR